MAKDNFWQRNESQLIGAGTGALGALFSIGARKKAHKRSMELMDKQYKKDKEMWDYQNAYNTPVRQMERLKEAGLNPALMYGQGTTGNANNMVQSKFQELSPYTSATDIAASTASGIQMSLVGAQKENIEADTVLKGIKGATESGQLKVAQDLATQNIAKMQQDIRKSQDDILSNISQRYNDAARRELMKMQTIVGYDQLPTNELQRAKLVADTQKVQTDTQLQKRIIATEYDSPYGKNAYRNLWYLGKQVNPENPELGAVSVVVGSALMGTPGGRVAKGSYKLGKAGYKTLKNFGKKNIEALKKIFKRKNKNNSTSISW